MKIHYELEYGSKFLKDLKLAKRRGLDLSELKTVTDMLQEGKKLPVQYRDHTLTGDYKGYRECHEDIFQIFHSVLNKCLIG